jgi:protein TonB
MSQAVSSEVFTVEEIARAAGASTEDVTALIAAGELAPIQGTAYIPWADAVRAVQGLRGPGLVGASPALAAREVRLPVAASLAVHTLLLAAMLWLSAGPTETARIDAPSPSTGRLVFIMSPGPGGGGGGGGLRNPLPPPPVERVRTGRPLLSVPAAVARPVVSTARREPEPPKVPTPIARPEPRPEPPLEPLPSRVLVAPVVSAASDDRDRGGLIEEVREAAASQGPGTDGGAGAGQGAGNGTGLGAGIGDGLGGGTGGGPYRPGSGIDPPRLLREVKAEYTEEARRRGVSGDVVLEIVVQRDGSVGAVTVLQGLGSGLDQRAVAAVRQWRFTPARIRNAAVDVIVEVAVEFTLR